MPVTVRPVREGDIGHMVRLLNEIIEIGGTTAYLEPVTETDMQSWVSRGGDRASWHVATDDAGTVLGFQWAEPHSQLPPEAASVATFVDACKVGSGIGSMLFEKTKTKARELGFDWLNASIRSDNDSGLRYYSKMGFEDWKLDPDATLSNGQVSGKHHKKYVL